MRLINVQTLELEEFGRFDMVPEYAILSHMWSEPEVLFKDYQAAYKRSRSDAQKKKSQDEESQGEECHIDTGKGMIQWKHLLRPKENKVPKNTGWGKIAWACREARVNVRGGRANHLWIDTCCINKNIPNEESEAISLMAQWYGGAKVCHAYLQDVSVNKEEYNKMNRQQLGAKLEQGQLGPLGWSRWFDRGWTLQELLAPSNLQFFDHSWRFINTRENLMSEVEAATKIDRKYLEYPGYKEACIAVKMSWMANRTTTKVEDTAYALLGLFEVRMQTDYGEGSAAFIRLQETLIEGQESQDESIFAWTDPTKQLLIRRPASKANQEKLKFYGLLAPWPSCFANMSSIVANSERNHMKRVAYNIQNKGVVFHLPAFFPNQGEGVGWNNIRADDRTEYDLSLNCWIAGKEDKGHVTIHLVRDDEKSQWKRLVEEDLMIAKCKRTSHDRIMGWQKTREARIPHVPPSETNWVEELSHWIMKRDDIVPVLGIERKFRLFRQLLKN